MIKKNKWLMVAFLVAAVAAFVFLKRFYYDGVRSLEAFVGSCETYDRAVAGLSRTMTDDAENKARDALIDLRAKAGFRLSSLIKHDAELMNQAREVADVSGKELDALEAYRRAVQARNADSDTVNAYRVLAGKREAAWARFRELGGLKDRTDRP
jgi:hypothetical protein